MSGYFQPDPVHTLATMEDVRAVLGETRPHRTLCGFSGMDVYRVKSDWLISLIREVIAGGEYPYNATVKKLAEQRLGFPPKTDAQYSNESDALSLLIYNAQGYRRTEQLRADGFEPFTDELLTRAATQRCQVEVQTEGIIGKGLLRLQVRSIGGKLYAMRPKMRKRYVAAIGQPARIVSPEEAA